MSNKRPWDFGDAILIVLKLYVVVFGSVLVFMIGVIIREFIS